jgi:membrane-bound serine protease (ClpP class)
VLLELFVLPGVGVLGFGGAILILVSIVLASQTFVIPRNQYQLEQLPQSLGVLIVGVAGAAVALGLLRNLIPRVPFLQRLMLPPPDAQTIAEQRRREAIVDFADLLGRRGEAVTQLTPAGKARLGDQVVNVVSEGDVIERGRPVEVIDVVGNRVVVRELAGR